MNDVLVDVLPYDDVIADTAAQQEDLTSGVLPEQEEFTSLSVSDGSAVPVVVEFDSDLGTINYLLSALLFFTIFEWVERKLLHAVGKVVGKNE